MEKAGVGNDVEINIWNNLVRVGSARKCNETMGILLVCMNWKTGRKAFAKGFSSQSSGPLGKLIAP